MVWGDGKGDLPSHPMMPRWAAVTQRAGRAFGGPAGAAPQAWRTAAGLRRVLRGRAASGGRRPSAAMGTRAARCACAPWLGNSRGGVWSGSPGGRETIAARCPAPWRPRRGPGRGACPGSRASALRRGCRCLQAAPASHRWRPAVGGRGPACRPDAARGSAMRGHTWRGYPVALRRGPPPAAPAAGRRKRGPCAQGSTSGPAQGGGPPGPGAL